MPPKTPSTTTAKTLAPPRLPPLPRLRVRRPNQAEANPCLGIMSSVLSTFPSTSLPLSLTFQVGRVSMGWLTRGSRLLGFLGVHVRRVYQAGASATDVHGRAEGEGGEEEYD